MFLLKEQNKIIQYCSIFIFFVILFLSLNFTVEAANLQNAFDSQYLQQTAGSGGAGYNINRTPEFIISTIIKAVLSFLGVIFLVLMIYGGYLWMTARGNEEQLTKAKNVIIAAVTGLVIVVAAYAISWFVVSKLGAGTLK